MGYLHIENLNAAKKILNNKKMYAQEKIHGTSARVTFHQHPNGKVEMTTSGGCVNSLTFSSVILATVAPLSVVEAVMARLGVTRLVVYGEAFGGKVNGMGKTYGPKTHFWAFDVEGNGRWLEIPHAATIAKELGLNFIPYIETTNDVNELNRLRDLDSVIAAQVFPEGDKRNEGVVLKGPVEADGTRLIAKHKQAWASEKGVTADVDPLRQSRIEQAEKYAEEWVNEMRVEHVADHLLRDLDPSREKVLNKRDIPAFIAEIVRDVREEAKDALPMMEEVDKEVARRGVTLFIAWLKKQDERLAAEKAATP
jgi:RNA ligase-like protein